MEITSIEKNRGKEESYSVYIEGKFAFSMPLQDFLSLGLYDKSCLSEEEVQNIKDFVIFKSAKSMAVKYVALRLRTEMQVRRKLEDHGYDEATIEQTLAELRQLGYIDDLKFAESFVRERSKLKPKPLKVLRYELKGSGVSDDIIEQVLSESMINEHELGKSLVNKKFGKYILKDEQITNRIYVFLQRKGFNYEIIDGIIEELMKEEI